jgi:uncharacterized protein
MILSTLLSVLFELHSFHGGDLNVKSPTSAPSNYAFFITSMRHNQLLINKILFVFLMAKSRAVEHPKIFSLRIDMTLLERFRQQIPTREQMTASPWLRWLYPLLQHPRLWHWSRRGVALGVGLGVFFGLLVPVAQIPLAAGAAVVLRANLPAAAASTFVTNPVTFAPIYYAAYRLGTWIMQKPPSTPPSLQKTETSPIDLSIWQRISNVGLPLLIGLAIVSTIAGVVCYGLISVGWYFYVKRRRHQRLKQRETQVL